MCRRQLRRVGILRDGDQDVRNIVFIGRGCGAAHPLHVAIQFARRDVDALDHIPGAQHLALDLAPQLLAVVCVVDALSGELLGQLIEAHLVASGNILQGTIDLLVGDRDSGVIGALLLNGLKHQPIEHLAPQDLGRRQRHILGAQALSHLADLDIELAFGHHAVIYYRDDPLQRVTVTRMGAR